MPHSPRRARHDAGRPLRRTGTRRVGLVATLLALVVAAASALGIWWWQREGTPSPGTYVAPTEITSSSSPAGSTSSPAGSTSSSSSSSSSATKAPRTKKPTSSTTSREPSSTTSSRSSSGQPVTGPAGDPTRVQVTSGGRSLVDASLQATYLDAQKVLAPPFGTAGWYAESGWPKPGHAGASILVGHINHGSNPDVFWNLPQVKVGDTVTVTYGSGRTVDFRITRSQAASKTAVPKDETIWDHDNPEPVLRLITCDPTTPLNGGHYEGNWVVWAEQA